MPEPHITGNGMAVVDEITLLRDMIMIMTRQVLIREPMM